MKNSDHTILFPIPLLNNRIGYGIFEMGDGAQRQSPNKLNSMKTPFNCLFSLLICMYWPSRTRTPSQSEIFCLIVSCSYTNRERMFHFGRLCWSCKANTYIRTERTSHSNSFETEYFTLRWCAGSEKPRHTIYVQIYKNVQNLVSYYSYDASFEHNKCHENV